MHKKWISIIPNNFIVPTYLKSKSFVFTPLTVSDIENDYLAVTDNIEHLKGTFDFLPNWPDKNITKEENLSNLGWHQTEFAMKTSFAYKIQKLPAKQYIGCLYIFPSNTVEYEVDVYFWLIKSEAESYGKVGEILKAWITKDWPFTKVQFKFE